MARFDEAIAAARETLSEIRDRTREELGDTHAAIFESHLGILDDVTFRPDIERRLREELLNVDWIVHDFVESYTRAMAALDDEMFRHRSMDFVDVGRRILSHLMNLDADSLEHLDHPSIVVAYDLTPSETVNMDLSNTLGLVTDAGGKTSHMAIFARAFEIPAVAGLRFAGSHVTPGDLVIIDGTRGRVILRPEPETIDEYEEIKKRFDAERIELQQAGEDGPCNTLDGHRVDILANIELPSETESAKRAHCDGIGLYRTEYLFMNRTTLPTEEEQFHAYRRVVETMAPAGVTIRTLDIGGDKIVSYLNRQPETNPQLGWRSIRFCLDRPDIFKAQLRALLRASTFGHLRIMFPMISGLDILRESIKVVDEVKDDLEKRGVAFDPDVEIGTMIEVPAAAMVAERLAQECSFLSVGTNDLIQYCLAVDRVNERTAHLYDPSHPGVLIVLKEIVKAAKKVGVPCTICGEMAGDELLTEVLLGLGFESLSMSAVSIPKIRARIAGIHLSKAKRFASKVMRTGSSSQIRALLKQRQQMQTLTTAKRP